MRLNALWSNEDWPLDEKLDSLRKMTTNVLYYWFSHELRQLGKSDNKAGVLFTLENRLVNWSAHFWKNSLLHIAHWNHQLKTFLPHFKHGLYTSNLLCTYMPILADKQQWNVHVHDCSCPFLLLGTKIWKTYMEKIGEGCGGPCVWQQPCFGPKNSKRPPWCVQIQNDSTERNREEEGRENSIAL